MRARQRFWAALPVRVLSCKISTVTSGIFRSACCVANRCISLPFLLPPLLLLSLSVCCAVFFCVFLYSDEGGNFSPFADDSNEGARCLLFTCESLCPARWATVQAEKKERSPCTVAPPGVWGCHTKNKKKQKKTPRWRSTHRPASSVRQGGEVFKYGNLFAFASFPFRFAFFTKLL